MNLELEAHEIPEHLREFFEPVPGLKPKDLVGIPWMVAFALRADGWYLRSEVIWAKPNPMPESVTDRPTRAHEQVFLLTKERRYHFDADAVREPQSETTFQRFGNGTPRRLHGPKHDPDGEANVRSSGAAGILPGGRNVRTVWEITPAAFAEAHFATFPPALAERCIKAGSSERGACPTCGAPWVRVVERALINTEGWGKATKDHRLSSDAVIRNEQGRAGDSVVHQRGWRPSCSCPPHEPRPSVILDCFAGAFTTLLAADRLGRDGVAVELKAEYCRMGEERLRRDNGLFLEVSP